MAIPFEASAPKVFRFGPRCVAEARNENRGEFSPQRAFISLDDARRFCSAVDRRARSRLRSVRPPASRRVSRAVKSIALPVLEGARGGVVARRPNWASACQRAPMYAGGSLAPRPPTPRRLTPAALPSPRCRTPPTPSPLRARPPCTPTSIPVRPAASCALVTDRQQLLHRDL